MYGGKTWQFVLMKRGLAGGLQVAASSCPPPQLPLLTGTGGQAPCIHFCSLHNLATVMFEAFHSSESWLEWSPVPKRCWVWVLRCSEWGGEHEVTCFAGIEDMGDTPVMSALWDNGMHKTASCYVSSLSSRGQKQQQEQCRNMSCRQAREAHACGAWGVVGGVCRLYNLIFTWHTIVWGCVASNKTQVLLTAVELYCTWSEIDFPTVKG